MNANSEYFLAEVVHSLALIQIAGTMEHDKELNSALMDEKWHLRHAVYYNHYEPSILEKVIRKRLNMED